MLTHNNLVKKMLKDPAVHAAYDELEEEFSLLAEILMARKKAGLTQAEVARRMGTKTPAIARIESGGGAQKHSPSIATLRRYAEAVGCRLQIKLVTK
ncbi:MAG: helix-turn-helix transcriptional regulator [Pseudomonadota bacterium]